MTLCLLAILRACARTQNTSEENSVCRQKARSSLCLHLPRSRGSRDSLGWCWVLSRAQQGVPGVPGAGKTAGVPSLSAHPAAESGDVLTDRQRAVRPGPWQDAALSWGSSPPAEIAGHARRLGWHHVPYNVMSPRAALIPAFTPGVTPTGRSVSRTQIFTSEVPGGGDWGGSHTGAVTPWRGGGPGSSHTKQFSAWFCFFKEKPNRSFSWIPKFPTA